MMEGRRTPIDDVIVKLARSDRVRCKPKICVIPTPTGDAESVIAAFDEAYAEVALTYHLAPFRKPRANSIPLSDIANGLRTMDAVFVTGGNTKSALGVWKEWGIDRDLRTAYDHGVLIAGMSAGASAWFEFGFSDSYHDGYRALPCLGWIAGGFCPHFNGENQIRATKLREAVDSGEMPRTIAVDDYAAVLFEDGAAVQVIAWREGCSAYCVSPGEERALIQLQP